MRNETMKSILKKAADKENGAYLLYKNAADNAHDAQTKAVLIKFAEEEQKHKQALEEFDIEDLKDQKIDITEDEHRQGITEFLVDTHEGIGEDSDFKDVLVYAAKREKKAFDFYDRMSKNVDDPKLRKLFIWLAHEESRHKEDIEALFWEVMYR